MFIRGLVKKLGPKCYIIIYVPNHPNIFGKLDPKIMLMVVMSLERNVSTHKSIQINFLCVTQLIKYFKLM